MLVSMWGNGVLAHYGWENKIVLPHGKEHVGVSRRENEILHV